MKKMIGRNIFIILFSLILLIPRYGIAQNRLYEINKSLEVYLEVYKVLNEDFVDELDPNHLMKIGIDAMTKSLDPYTRYISESQVESYRMSTEGKYEGIGVITKKIGDYITVIDAYDNCPALKAGMKIGDQITAINGLPTIGKSREDAKKIMRGVSGSKIDFQVLRANGVSKDLVVVRSEINIENVPYSGMVSDEVGYAILTTFTANASKNIAKAFKKLKRDHPEMKGFILDLRGNGGGLLREAIALVNLFVPKNIDVVSTKGKIVDRDKSFKTRSEPIDLDTKIVVLINGRSASASEIVSGSIQDLDRGVLMGQRSFGKGLVQNTKEIAYNSRLKLTTSKYYIPSGRCIQGVEYEDGKPKDIPDEERNVFYTKNGRKVLDGGGVTPDVKLEEKLNDPIIKELLSQDMIFNYVNLYCSTKDSIVPVSEFVFEDFDGFKTFASNASFEFKTKAEKILEKLKEEVKGGFMDEINAIETQINDKKTIAIEVNKAQIIKLIEDEIVNRYYFQSGKAEQQLKTDVEIKAAIELLNNTIRYKEILQS